MKDKTAAKKAEKKQVVTANAAEIDSTSEFNALANLICESANDVKTDNFKLDLFPKQPQDTMGPDDGGEYDESQVINIDLTTGNNNLDKAKEAAK